jgi:excisionase family DNA binding protein
MTSPRPGTQPDPATPGRARRAAPWQTQVLAALALYPDGACLARLTWKLADGTCGYEPLYNRIYRALRGNEANGHARRAGHQRTRGPTAWSQDITLRAGQLPVYLAGHPRRDRIPHPAVHAAPLRTISNTPLTVYRLISSGKLAAYRISKRNIRVDEQALRDYLARHAVGQGGLDSHDIPLRHLPPHLR